MGTTTRADGGRAAESPAPALCGSCQLRAQKGPLAGDVRRCYFVERRSWIKAHRQDRGRPARTRLVGQPLQPQLDEPRPPAVHRVVRDAESGRDLLVRPAFRAPQHDPCPQRQELCRLRPLCPSRQFSPLGIGQHQFRLAPARPWLIHQPRHPPGSSTRAGARSPSACVRPLLGQRLPGPGRGWPGGRRRARTVCR